MPDNPVEKRVNQTTDDWTAEAFTRYEGHEVSGPMTYSKTKHDWEITNTSGEDLEIDWECQHEVTRENDANFNERMTRHDEFVEFPAGATLRYQWPHLVNSNDWFTLTGRFFVRHYTEVRVFKQAAGAPRQNRGSIKAGELVHDFTINGDDD